MAAIDPRALATQVLPYGVLKWLVSPTTNPGSGVSVGEVVLLPGCGHERHNHDDFEQVMYVLSGRGLQTLELERDDSPFPLVAGDALYIPRGVFHSTMNDGWQPLRLLTVYSPGGGETGLGSLPGARKLSPGEAGSWTIETG
jgi:oxalate decarboxylase/phosphoglucose isomerase-like protein (cupin superfamily)